MTQATITIQIGNSDDKLGPRQRHWHEFVKELDATVERFWGSILKRSKDMTTATITIRIGNSDDKLVQRHWHEFVKDLGATVERFWGSFAQVHFSGGSSFDAPWQNYCIVIEVPARGLVDSLQRWRARLARLALEFNQDCIVMTVGKTEMVPRHVPEYPDVDEPKVDA